MHKQFSISNILSVMFGLVAASILVGCARTGSGTRPPANIFQAPPPATAESLFKSASAGDSPAVRAILKEAPNLITATNSDGLTALHLAVFRDGREFKLQASVYAETVELLIAQAADVNALAKHDLTPLHLVVTYPTPRGNFALGVNKRPYPEVLDESQLRSMRALLNHKANINAVTDSGLTALKMAATYGRTEMVKQLLASGADASIRDKKGESALDAAKRSGHSEIVSILGSR